MKIRTSVGHSANQTARLAGLRLAENWVVLGSILASPEVDMAFKGERGSYKMRTFNIILKHKGGS